jgi:AraC-like DNA-binding protein
MTYAFVYTLRVDALDGLLDGPRARGAFLLRSIMEPPWCIRVQDQAPLTLVGLVRGEAWVRPDVGKAVRLQPGDVALLRGPDAYIVADHPATPPQVVIHPGQRCTTVDGRDLSQAMDLGVRTWGNDPHGSTIMAIGTYQQQTEVGTRLLSVLPPLVVMPERSMDSPLVPLLTRELTEDEPGQHVVLDRLLDVLLVAVLRAWLARAEADAPAWYRARGDPVVGSALRLLQNNPAHPWTVATLATATHVSRAALARRFTELVGEPPMTFLAGWRMALAADLLRDTDATLEGVAHQVGYGSPFALSAAFKRLRGVSPEQHRLAAAAR